jgi:very-short-patch-repair endonuclease
MLMSGRTRMAIPAELKQRLGNRAREFRREPTRGEALLWQELRAGKRGPRFRRQHPIGPFIVDFYCPEANLVVEIDGPIHETQQERDQAREALLRQRGYQILRIAAIDVEPSMPIVLTTIDMLISPKPPQPSSPSPSAEGEGAGG